jgi:hypothetical protein
MNQGSFFSPFQLFHTPLPQPLLLPFHLNSELLQFTCYSDLHLEWPIISMHTLQVVMICGHKQTGFSSTRVILLRTRACNEIVIQ